MSPSIPLLRLVLKSNAKHVDVKIRNYSDSQRKLMRKLAGRQLEAGQVYPDPAAEWSCASHLGPKPGPAVWRFIVDLRAVSRYKLSFHFSMLLIKVELDRPTKAEVFCKFDVANGNRQLFLHKGSQKCRSFVTRDGTFSTTRVQHENLIINAHLYTAFISKMSTDLESQLPIWVDDVAAAVKDIEDALKCITKLLDFCVQVKFKQYPVKFRLFKNSNTWCGQHISVEEVKFDP